VDPMVDMVDPYRKFLDIEDEMNLFNTTINNVRFWDWLRVPVFLAIRLRARSKASDGYARRHELNKLRRFFTSIIQLKRNALLSPRNDVLIIASSRRVLEKDGLWWDISTDHIIDEMNPKPLVVEPAFMNRHYEPAKTPGLRYLDFIDFVTYLLRITRIARVRLTKDESKLLLHIQKRIFEEFEINLDILGMTKRILEERKVRVPLFKLMLMRTKPKVVVLAQGYLWEDTIEACKLLGIPSVELQHGVISPFAIAYSYEGPFRKKETFTDYLLVFGDYWKSCAQYPIPNNRVISVGFPYFENRRKEYSKIAKKKQIVFISQDTVGAVLSRVASDLSKLKDFDYNIVYKLHPQECERWREKYPWLVTSDVRVVDEPNVLLYEIFAESMIQVGVYSTALYEGLGFSLRTYIFDIPGAIYSKPLYETGLAKKVNSVEDLASCIMSDKLRDPFDLKYLFKPNSVNNIISFLNRFLQKKSVKG
jgi:hypothetical protein